jgi:hypothetical protein
VRESGLYRVLIDPITLLCSSERLDEPPSFEEARVHVGEPKSSMRVSIQTIGDMLVILYWFLPFVRLLVVLRRRGVIP